MEYYMNNFRFLIEKRRRDGRFLYHLAFWYIAFICIALRYIPYTPPRRGTHIVPTYVPPDFFLTNRKHDVDAQTQRRLSRIFHPHNPPHSKATSFLAFLGFNEPAGE
jgi:hypothetical protein